MIALVCVSSGGGGTVALTVMADASLLLPRVLLDTEADDALATKTFVSIEAIDADDDMAAAPLMPSVTMISSVCII
jgi:hypothetical protein